MPTQRDMQISLDDAGFFCEKIDEIVRGQPEQQQNLELVRRYFRAYLHCWKCIIYYICEEKGINGKEFGKWVRQKWLKRRSSPHANEDIGSLDALRKTRDEDTHVGAITVNREIADGLYPLVMFQPSRHFGPPRELISMCEHGLMLADRLIRDHK